MSAEQPSLPGGLRLYQMEDGTMYFELPDHRLVKVPKMTSAAHVHLAALRIAHAAGLAVTGAAKAANGEQP